MGLKSNIKGKRGEREVLNVLGEILGERFERNLQQSDTGGCDCLQLDGFALEVKRAAAPKMKAWWEQAVRQAIALNKVPVLAYRLDRQQWVFRMPASILFESNGVIEMGAQEFCDLYRTAIALDERTLPVSLNPYSTPLAS